MGHNVAHERRVVSLDKWRRLAPHPTAFFASSRSFSTLFQLRAVFGAPIALSKRSASFDFEKPRGATCDDANRCEPSFGKVPTNSIVIIETITCLSEPPTDRLGDFATLFGPQNSVAFAPSSANPSLEVLTSAYLPFRAGERITVTLGGKSETIGSCSITGRVPPEG